MTIVDLTLVCYVIVVNTNPKNGLQDSKATSTRVHCKWNINFEIHREQGQTRGQAVQAHITSVLAQIDTVQTKRE